MVETEDTPVKSAAAEGEHPPFIEPAPGARVYAEVTDGVLVLRVYPGDLPLSVRVDDAEIPVSLEPAGKRKPGKHRKILDPSQDTR
jgi:hypothetical protein